VVFSSEDFEMAIQIRILKEREIIQASEGA